MPITHSHVNPIADDPVAEAAGEVTPTRWNADHVGDHDPVTVGTGLDVTGQLVELDLSEVAAGGELAGFLDAPTVDATHSGSTHAATQSAAEATAAGALSTHAGAADPHTGYVREADANWTDLTDAGETALHSHAGGGSGGLAIYGDGNLGDVVFDGVAEIEGATLDAGDYTLTATLYADDVTIEAGVTVNANNWPIYARGTLTNEGVIHNDASPTSPEPGNSYALIPGSLGAEHVANFGNGIAGVVRYRASQYGTGGAGGAAGGFSGGSAAEADPWWTLDIGGSGSITPANLYDIEDAIEQLFTEAALEYIYASRFVAMRIPIHTPFAGGASGGSGAANGGDEGDGGSGGGVVLIKARHIVNNGTIRALGGDAPTPILLSYPDWSDLQGFTLEETIAPTTHLYRAETAGTSGAVEPTWTDDGNPVADDDFNWLDMGLPAAGHGGGGQGGYLIFYYDTFTGDVPDPAIDCAGGAGGAGVGAGDAGTAGDDGHVFTVENV